MLSGGHALGGMGISPQNEARLQYADHATPWTRAPSSSRPSLVLGSCFNARTIFKNKCELSHFGSRWVYKAQSHRCPKKESLISRTHPRCCLIKSLHKSHLHNMHSKSHEPQSLFRVHEETTPAPLANMQTFGRLAEQSSCTKRGMGLAWHGCRVN